MKNTGKKIISIILSIFIIVGVMYSTAFAASKTSGKCGKNAKWSFDTDTGTLVISGKGQLYQWQDENKIPWRKYSDTITSVKINKGIKNIPDNAFSWHRNLNHVSIAKGVTEIGEYAFEECTNLSNVSIPSSVKSIGRWAFCNTPWLKAKGDFAIVNKILIAYQGNKSKVTVPSGVKTIGSCAFAIDLDDPVNRIKLPNSVTRIDNWGLAGCWITSIVIPDSVTYIGQNAFCEDYELKSVKIGKKVKTIDAYAFYDCDNLKSIYIPKNVKKIGSRAFGFCGDEGVFKSKNFQIKGVSGTPAQKYAKKYKFKFKAVK